MTSPSQSGPPPSTELAEVRRQINELVRNGAVGMVETTIEQVGKGHYLGMKYLFEMIGLYPATSTDAALVQDSMAAVLLRRLGLSEAEALGQGVTKDSGTAAEVDGDGLE